MDFVKILDEIIALCGDTDTISSISLQMYGLMHTLDENAMKYFRRIKGSESIYQTFVTLADYCLEKGRYLGTYIRNE